MHAVALDLGASGGKMFRGSFDGSTLSIQEIHRFPNAPVLSDGHLTWDVKNIYAHLLDGLRKAAATRFSSFGMDSFCNDYVLLDAHNSLIPPVYMYRDHRTEDMQKWIDQAISPRELYHRTGNQRARFNALVQWIAERHSKNSRLDGASSLLFLSDYLHFRLCGVKAAEYTTASVSQFFNRRDQDWDSTILDTFQIPRQILSKIIPPCTILGPATSQAISQIGIHPFDICTVGQHDTASAVAAVPAAEKNFAYISSGTWSLMGIETDAMITSEAAFQENLANEGGLAGRNRFLKNIMGLWLLQDYNRQLSHQGKPHSYDEMDRLASQAEAFRSLIDPDDPRFFEPGDMAGRIQAWCSETGQPIPSSVGEVTRCIYESLALSYRNTLEILERVGKVSVSCIHIIGGGAKSDLLNQMAASAMNRHVIAGPVEAAAIGNLCAQFMAAGELKDLEESRHVIRSSFQFREFFPTQSERWQEGVLKFFGVKAKKAPTI